MIVYTNKIFEYFVTYFDFIYSLDKVYNSKCRYNVNSFVREANLTTLNLDV